MTKQIALACVLLAGFATMAIADDSAPDSTRVVTNSMQPKGMSDVRNGRNVRNVVDGLKSRHVYGQLPSIKKMTSAHASSS
jgi:hypothetical protein